jgi:hypothetical protein
VFAHQYFLRAGKTGINFFGQKLIPAGAWMNG